MTATRTSRAAEDWIFDGGALALDFLNTLRDRTRRPRETLHTTEDLVEWFDCALAAGAVVPPGAAIPAQAPPGGRSTEAAQIPGADEARIGGGSARLLAEARRLRAAIDALLSPGLHPTAADARRINRRARGAPVPRLDEDHPDRTVAVGFGARDVLGAVAADAIALVAAGEAKGVKVCAHERCGLRFLDQSRGGRRKWCSMERCGNRAKAARHAAGKATVG
ncbi:CGNR zinc finger domain-containing protein [Sediminivirga luteola]|uniref:Zinc finger CGNR domain-containing protein n=1 Tax=Sediminivirga luteola TaxID=1774748 RepID=A0A8J2TYL9_9MICO|nr:CGNR zinc finger domain-containing protein [Sediminivirga luteola]MCI2265978.1 CGNR zinc finger domain-containing protein [Sediminivirga luteola]GGA16547.1 hypothetical protein GCM10011333_19580 [Sediminivirga luteola]